MKIFESIVCCAILAIFSSLSVGVIVPCIEIYKKTQQMKETLYRDKFLVNGFLKVCKENKDENLKISLMEWKKMCLSLWPLDFLRINKNGKTIVESWSFNGKITSVKFSYDE